MALDVIIIGGGVAGIALAERLLQLDLSVVVVESDASHLEQWSGEWVAGKGLVSGESQVTVLDPETGDERRILHAPVTVFAVGGLNPSDLPGNMLGIAKYGAELSPDKSTIQCNSRGETRAPGIFAVGGCASASTPLIVDGIVNALELSRQER